MKYLLVALAILLVLLAIACTGGAAAREVILWVVTLALSAGAAVAGFVFLFLYLLGREILKGRSYE